MDTQIMEPIGVELGRLCKLHGYTMKEVAGTFGVSRMTVHNWFIGKHVPTQSLMPKVTKVLEHLREKPIPTNDE